MPKSTAVSGLSSGRIGHTALRERIVTEDRNELFPPDKGTDGDLS